MHWEPPLSLSIQALKESLVARFLLALCLCQVTLSVQGQVFDVPHQQDAPTRTLFVGVQNPKALVLLFQGGGGMSVIFDNGTVKSRHTFVRSLDLWAQYGMDAVLVDSPYDLGNQKKGNLRGLKDHLSRVNEVINFYKTKLDLPIWIFGHSMGSSTATYYANELDPTGKQVAGIIIAGTIKSASLSDDVTIPVLGIHHQDDDCSGTPVVASSRIIEGRPKNYISKLEIIEGGISKGDVCDSFAYHGFNQTEPEFIKRAAQFILNQK